MVLHKHFYGIITHEKLLSFVKVNQHLNSGKHSSTGNNCVENKIGEMSSMSISNHNCAIWKAIFGNKCNVEAALLVDLFVAVTLMMLPHQCFYPLACR